MFAFSLEGFVTDEEERGAEGRGSYELARDFFKFEKPRRDRLLHVAKINVVSPLLFNKITYTEKWMVLANEVLTDLREVQYTNAFKPKHFETVGDVEKVFDLFKTKLDEENVNFLGAIFGSMNTIGRESKPNTIFQKVWKNDVIMKWAHTVKSRQRGKDKRSLRHCVIIVVLVMKQVNFVFKKLLNHREEYVLEPTCSSDAKWHRDEAESEFQKRNYEKAFRLLLTGLRTSPYCAELYCARGRCYHKLDKFRNSLSDGKRSIFLKPHWDEGQFCYIQSLIELKRYHQAKDAHDEAVRLCGSSQLLDDLRKELDQALGSETNARQSSTNSLSEKDLPADLPDLVSSNSSEDERESGFHDRKKSDEGGGGGGGGEKRQQPEDLDTDDSLPDLVNSSDEGVDGMPALVTDESEDSDMGIRVVQIMKKNQYKYAVISSSFNPANYTAPPTKYPSEDETASQETTKSTDDSKKDEKPPLSSRDQKRQEDIEKSRERMESYTKGPKKSKKRRKAAKGGGEVVASDDASTPAVKNDDDDDEEKSESKATGSTDVDETIPTEDDAETKAKAFEFEQLKENASLNFTRENFKEAKALLRRIIEKLSTDEGEISDAEHGLLLYGLGVSLLRTSGSSASDAKEAIAILEKTVKTIGKEFVPSFRAALAEGYLKEYRFSDALHEARAALEMLPDREAFCWPEVTVPINKELEERLQGFIAAALHPPKCDAYDHSVDYEGRREIYFADPDFKGFFRLLCSEGCRVEYLPSNWKNVKAERNISVDKHFLQQSCLTPDCSGEITLIEKYDQDSTGDPVKQYRADVKKETDDGKASARGGSGKQQQQKMMMERKMAGAAAQRQKREKEKEKEKERDSEREKEKPVASIPAREEVATKEDPKAEELDNASVSGGDDRSEYHSLTPDGTGEEASVGKPSPSRNDQPETRRHSPAFVVLKKDESDAVSRKGHKRKKRPKVVQRLEGFFGSQGRQEAGDTAEKSDKKLSRTLSIDSQNPFAVPPQLKDHVQAMEAGLDVSDLPRPRLPSSEAKAQNIEETEVDESGVLSLFVEILRHHGPMEVSDQRIQDVFALLPDNVHTFVKKAGGLYKFLQRWPEIRTDGKRLSLIEDDDVAAADDDDEDDNEDARPERRQAKQKSTTENSKVDDDDGLPYVPPTMSDAYSPWATTSDVSSERLFWPASHLSSSSVAIDVGGGEGEKVSKFMSFFDSTVGGGGGGGGGDNAKATLSSTSSAVQTDGGVVESRAVQTNDNFVVRVDEMEKELKKLEKEKRELAFKLDESRDKIVKLQKKMQVDADAFQERVAAQVEVAKKPLLRTIADQDTRWETEVRRNGQEKRSRLEVMKQLKAKVRDLEDEERKANRARKEMESSISRLREESQEHKLNLEIEMSRFQHREKDLQATARHNTRRAEKAEVQVLELQREKVITLLELSKRDAEVAMIHMTSALKSSSTAVGAQETLAEWQSYLTSLARVIEDHRLAFEDHIQSVQNGREMNSLTPINIVIPMRPALTTARFQQPQPQKPVAQSQQQSQPPPAVPAPAQTNAQASSAQQSAPPSQSAAPSTQTAAQNAQQRSESSQPANGGARGAAGGPPSGTSASAAKPAKLNSYEKIMSKLGTLFPTLSRPDLAECVKIVRMENRNSLSGLQLDEIVCRVTDTVLSRFQSKLPPAIVATLRQQQQQRRRQPPPTHHHHSSAKPSRSSTRGSAGYDDEEMCVICHEAMSSTNRVMLQCGHRFHIGCIRKWLTEQSTCPTCRVHSLLPDEYPSLK